MEREFGPELDELIAKRPLPELGSGQPDLARLADLERRIPEALRASRKIVNEEMARAGMAGLWLHFDFLDTSHRISQEIGAVEGSYWHGVMHRREGDFGNASYWFRRAGELPFFAALGQEAAQMLASKGKHPELARLTRGDSWDPYRFVDICKACINGIPAIEEPCRQLQLLEWQHLFQHTLERAMTGR